jgi:hypothetical protein
MSSFMLAMNNREALSPYNRKAGFAQMRFGDRLRAPVKWAPDGRRTRQEDGEGSTSNTWLLLLPETASRR